MQFAVLNIDASFYGDELDAHFSDGSFTFPTWWLYLTRKGEEEEEESGLPHPYGALSLTPSEARVIRVQVTGAGVRATADVVWNNGTRTRFPALWLRVLGPTKGVEGREDAEGEARLRTPGGGNPRSGVGGLTVDEKRVRDRYREMLVEVVKEYVGEEWLLEVSTSLLREMVGFVEVEIRSQSVASQASAAEGCQNAAAVDLRDEDSLVEEGMG